MRHLKYLGIGLVVILLTHAAFAQADTLRNKEGGGISVYDREESRCKLCPEPKQEWYLLELFSAFIF